jgi:NADH dehydrogenase
MSLATDSYDLMVLGASFAGLEVAYQVAKTMPNCRVLVIDRRSEHAYIPLIHEILCGGLSPQVSTLNTKACLAGAPNLAFVVGEIVKLHPQQHEVSLADGRSFRGAEIVVALGSEVVAPPELPGHSFLAGLKFKESGESIAQQIRSARRLADPQPVRVIVVGGGISGVELAGELAMIATSRDASERPLNISLIQSQDRLLPALHRRAGERARTALERQGVDVRLATQLVSAHRGGLTLREQVDGHVEETLMPCELAFWAAGVRPSPVLAKLGLQMTDRGWIAVDPNLRPRDASGAPIEGLWCIGDAARVVEDGRVWPTMLRAIEALWQAWVVLRTLRRRLRGNKSGKPARHRLIRDFPHGVSVGSASLLIFGPIAFNGGRFAARFRRFLLRMYVRRYGPLR